MCGRGQPRWRVLSLEMLSTYTCYSRFHWRWFGYVSPCYWTTWSSLVLAHFKFLMDHVSDPVVPHVSFLLVHVSWCGWITCHFFIGPCGIFLLVHVVVSYSTMHHGTIHPRFAFLFGHVAWWHPSTCWISNSPCVCSGNFTCHALVPPRVIRLGDVLLVGLVYAKDVLHPTNDFLLWHF